MLGGLGDVLITHFGSYVKNDTQIRDTRCRHTKTKGRAVRPCLVKWLSNQKIYSELITKIVFSMLLNIGKRFDKFFKEIRF